MIADAIREAKRIRKYQATETELLPWVRAYRRLLAAGVPFDLESHRYLAAIYEDASRELVIMKSGQAGASEYCISRALWSCDVRHMNVLYLLPTISDISDFSQMRIGTPLYNSKHHLAIGTRLFAAFSGPANRAVHRGLHIPGRCAVWWTVVKGHGDVRAEFALDLHGFFGAQEQRGPVEVRSEFNAMRPDLANLGEAEHLESATVGQDGLLPVHETMQPACRVDDLHARPDVQMVGVAQNDLRAHLLQFAGINGLHRRLSAHGHEHGRVNHTMLGAQPPETRFGTGISLEQLKHAERGCSGNSREKPSNTSQEWGQG